jgi:hypothetical protein
MIRRDSMTEVEDEIYFNEIFSRLYFRDKAILYAKEVLGLSCKEIIERRDELGVSPWASRRHRVDSEYKQALRNFRTLVKIDNGEPVSQYDLRRGSVQSFYWEKNQ